MRLTVFFLILILFSCSESTRKKDVEVVLTKHKGKNFVCISMKNNTNKRLYIPQCTALSMGLKVFIRVKNNEYINSTDDFFTAHESIPDDTNYVDIKRCCMPMKYKFLSQKEKDSIATSIVANSNNRHRYLRNRIVFVLDELILIDPYQQFNDYYTIPDSTKYKNIKVLYSYPYSYPIYRSDFDSVENALIENNKKMLDSLKFDYPKYIKGYGLYDQPIVSDTLYVNE